MELSTSACVLGKTLVPLNRSHDCIPRHLADIWPMGKVLEQFFLDE